MASEICLWNNAEDYADIAIYVDRRPLDWKFTISLNKETGTIYDGPLQVADHPHGTFDETDRVPPDEVMSKYLRLRPEAVKILEELK